MVRYKKIGIIGGQGPASTIDIYERIIKYFQDKFGARYVRDFPPMVIFSVPTPNLVETVEDEAMTFSIMADAIKGLEREGSEFIAITCVSLQYFIDRLQTLVKIPIIGMSSVLATNAKDMGYKTVGLLGTHTTIKKKICDKQLREQGINIIIPSGEDQVEVEKVIQNEIAGRTTAHDKEELLKVIQKLEKNGVDAVLLACTELPIVLKQSDTTTPIIDCNELYSQEIAQYSSRN